MAKEVNEDGETVIVPGESLGEKDYEHQKEQFPEGSYQKGVSHMSVDDNEGKEAAKRNNPEDVAAADRQENEEFKEVNPVAAADVPGHHGGVRSNEDENKEAEEVAQKFRENTPEGVNVEGGSATDDDPSDPKKYNPGS